MGSIKEQVTIEIPKSVASVIAQIAKREKKSDAEIVSQLITEALETREDIHDDLVIKTPFITEADIEEIKKRLIATYNPLQIYIFGSYAWGLPDEESDIDLMVIVPASDNPKIHQRGYEGNLALKDLDFPKELIILTKEEFETRSNNKNYLAYKVKHHGKCIFDRS